MSPGTATPVLVFDADDTLWENNQRFDRTFTAFVDWLAARSVPAARVRDVFATLERENTRRHGYGSAVFIGSLRDTFGQILGRPASAEESAHIDTLVEDLRRNRVEPVPGAVETLRELASRHRLILLTKGIDAEQQAKIDTSGLASFFDVILIVAEKDVSTYQDLIARQDLDAGTTWMIGNSPQSDVNPARAAGLNAVYIPNPNTWALEHDEIDHSDPAILELTAIAQLTQHF